jgi:hypothetical protein
MGNIAFIPLSIFTVTLLFVIDKAFQNAFVLFNYFSFTVLILVFLLNVKERNISVVVYFAFGILVDWYFKLFFGVSSLLSVLLLYASMFMFSKFAGNRWSLFGFNIAVSYVLIYIANGYGKLLTFQYFVAALVNALIMAIFLLIKEA